MLKFRTEFRPKKMRDSGQRMNLVILSEGAIDRNGKPITANQVKDVSSKKNY